MLNVNVQSFQADLEAIPWDYIFSITDVNKKVEFLTSNVVHLFNIHAPVRTGKTRRSFSPWLTPTIKLMQKMRDEALDRYKLTRLAGDWNYYKQLRNFTNLSICNEKKAYLAHKLRSCSIKERWRELRNFGVGKENDDIPDQLRDVNSINTFLAQLYKNIPATDLTLITRYISSKIGDFTFSFRETNDSEIITILMAVSSRAYGDDGINSVMLLMCCPFLIPYITHVVNSAISQAIFPCAWKRSLITPIPKVKHPSSYDQLRYISILPALSKILEKVMELQIREYVSRCNFLPEFQSGFRRGYSCCSALAKVTDDILGEWDRDNLSVLILIDYSKAFDTLDYSTLVAILHHLGFDLKARLFISSFLSGRIQKVKVGGAVSDACAVTAGVPQGSVLSPLLYTLYTSLLFKGFTHNKYHLYADDTQIYCSFSINNIQEASRNINLELEKLSSLSRSHCLTINPDKTTAILIGNSSHIVSVQNLLHISIDGKSIPLKSNVKNLGLVFDSNLRFKYHVNLMLRRSYASLKMIYPNRHILDIGVKKMLCDSIVLSHFNHCDVVYDACLDSFDKKGYKKSKTLV